MEDEKYEKSIRVTPSPVRSMSTAERAGLIPSEQPTRFGTGSTPASEVIADAASQVYLEEHRTPKTDSGVWWNRLQQRIRLGVMAARAAWRDRI